MMTTRVWLVLWALLAAPSLRAAEADEPRWTNFMGFSFFNRHGGLWVEKLEHLSFAEVIGIKPKDEILAVNDFPVRTPVDFERVLRYQINHRPGRWTFKVSREGYSQPFVVSPAKSCDPLAVSSGCGPFPR